MALPPGPSSPALVQTLRYLAGPSRFLTNCHQRYGDIFTISTILFGPEVIVVRPEHVKLVFTGDPDRLRAGEANEALEPLVGRRSLLLLDGAEHLRQRRLMMPPFLGSRMAAYAKTMRDITTRAVARWPRKKRLVLHPEMQSITLEIILRTIFGADEGAELDGLRDSIVALLRRISSPITILGTTPAFRYEALGLSPWAGLMRAKRKVDALIYQQIDRRRRDPRGGERSDVLSLLLAARDEDGNAMTDVELRDELMTLLAAGHETTATELAWAFDLVLRDRRVLARIQAEIAAAAEDGAVDFDRMPYVDATIREVLRLRPVIPAVARRVKDDMVVGGFDVRAGMLLVPGVWVTHRLPEIYPEPEAFRPERFLDSKHDPYAWLPFGGGIRRCLGMAFALFEMKVVLATVLSSVSLRVTKRRPSTVALRGFTHAPKTGVPVIVQNA